MSLFFLKLFLRQDRFVLVWLTYSKVRQDKARTEGVYVCLHHWSVGISMAELQCFDFKPSDKICPGTFNIDYTLSALLKVNTPLTIITPL